MLKKRILVAEDDPEELEFVEVILQNAGFDVITADDGLKTLELAHDELQRPDLILLDLNMPKIDGYKVCRRLKHSSKYRDIPIIMLTGRTQASDKLLGFASEADDYLTKPFNADDLLSRIRELLPIKESPREKGDLGG